MLPIRRMLPFLLTLSMLLSSCATRGGYSLPPMTTEGEDARVRLAEAATSSTQSLSELKAIEKASSGPIGEKHLVYPTSYGMSRLVSIDWTGPLGPLLKRVALLCQYRLRVIGPDPAMPVLVTVNTRNTPLHYVLRDANFQAGQRASVFVYPAIRVIELRYAHA